MGEGQLAMRAHLELVTPADDQTLALAFVRDQHLRSPNGTAEDAYIKSLIGTSQALAERLTRRALLTQTWRLVRDAFPCGSEPIVLPKPPLQSVTSVTYVDGDGVEQSWGGSPLLYDVSAPSGPTAGYARITPAYGQTYPATRAQAGAVTVTFVAGWASVDDVPADIVHGQLLVIGELYKQRSESVHAFNQNPALIRARELWMQYRVW